jgi:hypothetical protein
VDLGDPDSARDLLLAHRVEVREAKEEALPRIEDPEPAGERNPVLAQLVAVVDRALPVELAVLSVHELRHAQPERRVELLESPWDPDRPRPVAEMPLDLTLDRRDREGREVDAPIELEAVDRVDEPDRADLYEILVGLAAADVPAREPADEREVLLDERGARLNVAMPVVQAKEAPGRRAPRRERPWRLRTPRSRRSPCLRGRGAPRVPDCCSCRGYELLPLKSVCRRRSFSDNNDPKPRTPLKFQDSRSMAWVSPNYQTDVIDPAHRFVGTRHRPLLGGGSRSCRSQLFLA